MTYTITSLIADIRRAIDEIAPNDAEFISSQDSTEMDSIITSVIPEAGDYVVMNADRSLFSLDQAEEISATAATEGATYDEQTKMLSIDISLKDPARLLYANVQTAQGQDVWAYPLTSFITESDNEYAEVRDPYVGATPDRPAAVIRSRNVSGDRLKFVELWTLSAATDIAIVSIHNRITISQGGTIDIDSHLHRALVYQAAAHTLATYNEQRAQTLFALARQQMGAEEPSPSVVAAPAANP